MAYPILYKANETNFEHLGVSVLSDASKCYVSRERNGIYILEFDYPVNGKDVDKIKEGMYIKADAGYRTKNQRFIVSKITKTQNEFKLYCQHISQVKTTMNAIRPDITVTSVSAMGALRAWRDNLLDSREEFFVQSDISTLNSTTWKVENIENARDALGGKAGSILDVWGGEYEFDNLNITLHKSMGIDNPTIIAYGKNLLDLEQEQSILETYTSVFPFKKYTDDNNREQLITLPEILLDSTYLNKFTHRRILKVDFSNDENLKTVEQLRSKAKSYIKSNNVGVPKTNLKINYQDLSKVEGVFDNPALEQIDLCDRLKVYYNELGILNENAKVVKVVWDVILEENHEIEVGDSRSSFTDSTSAKLESLQVQNDSVLARINALVAEQEAAFDRFFKEKSKVIEDKVKGGYEKALLSSEEKIRKMGEAFDEKINQFREQVSTAVENYNRQFQATNLEISKNRVEATKQIQAVNLEISKSRIEATKQIQALSDRVNNMQDISNNETVVELRGLVNGATSKVTELETSITREFTAVKKKNEDGLSAVKAEFKKGVDGLTSKVSSLEEYRNQDGTRTESLKQWVQRDTANQLSRERTEINRIVDAKGYVKNTEFSNKFNENAQGINRKLEALETYKNQDGVRTANLQIWTQNNTANQLTAARRSIESWVDDKGYATNSVVENKVQETANSISREIRNIRESIPTSVGGRNYITDSDKLTNINSGGTNWEKTVENGTLVFTKVRATESTGIWTQIMPFLKDNFQNEVLTWSVDVKASKNISFNNVGQETNGFKGRVDITTQWQRISHTFTNKYTQHYAFVFYQMIGTCSPGDKVYVRLPKLEIGNVATDWTPSPEDNNAFVKNTEFSNKFNENARGITNQLTALENYKNQDGARVANMQIWAQNNTANQLTAERRNIEKWVNDKGYATTSVVENKVQETANSFSREISNVREVIKDKVLSNDNLLLGTKDFIPKHFAPAAPWQRPLVWETETERYNDFAVKSTIYHLNGLWQDVAVEKGKTYEYGFFAKGSRYTNKIIFSPGWASNDAKRPLAEYNIRNTEFTLTTNWKFHSFRFTVTSSGWSQCRVEKIEQNNGIKLSICGLYLREVKNNETSPLGWKPAFEDEQLSINELNLWKQTTTGTLNTVTSTLNDTVRHSQLRVGADKIDFGSNKVFDGRNLASMLSVSPESIKAITDRLIISPANENLVLPEFRDRAKSNNRDTWLTSKINVDGISIGDEYIFKGGIYPEIGTTTPHNINFILEYKSRQYGTNWITSRIISANGYSNERNYTLRVNVGITDIEYIRLGVQQETFQNYKALDIYNAQIYKKKSAELIVDGSIEGRQIKTETLETGHHKAGSITSEIIAANAVKAKHILIDDGLINNLVSHKAFITKLWAQDAFIRSLKTVKISATQLDTDWLSAYTGDIGGFRIGHNPNDNGFWLTGANNFDCGINPGLNAGSNGAQLWAAWGNLWTSAGPNAWWVTAQGIMVCKNTPTFHKGMEVYGRYIDVHGNDIQGDKSGGGKTSVVWWSQINKANSSSSDKRLKTNIKPTKIKALETLNNIEMVEFNWKKDNKFEKIGAIAQQVQSIEESFVVQDMDDKQTYNDYLRISYYNTIPYLIKAVQELSEENNKLKNKLEELING